MIPGDFPNKTVYDSMHFYQHFTIHDIPKKIARPEILTWNGIFGTNYFICKYLYNHRNFFFAYLQQIKWFQMTQFYNITTQSVAFPRTLHLSMMPILTFNFDLWPPKSIEFILSPWLTCLPSLMKKHTQWFSLYRVHKLISIHVSCDFELWPLTSHLQNQ